MLDVTITSRVAKFDLNTLLTILSILVGSGLILEIGRRVLQKRTRAPETVARSGTIAGDKARLSLEG